MNLANHFLAMVSLTPNIQDGRINVHDYWFYVLETIIIGAVLSIANLILGNIQVIGTIYAIAYYIIDFALTIVGLSLAVQRVRDAGHSGWYYCIGFIPLVGWIFLLIALLKDSGTPNINC